jgi:hypothetical protein
MDLTTPFSHNFNWLFRYDQGPYDRHRPRYGQQDGRWLLFYSILITVSLYVHFNNINDFFAWHKFSENCVVRKYTVPYHSILFPTVKLRLKFPLIFYDWDLQGTIINSQLGHGIVLLSFQCFKNLTVLLVVQLLLVLILIIISPVV